MLGDPDGVVPVVLVEIAELLTKYSNVTQMISSFSDRITLGSVNKYDVVNS